jgi:surface antigen
LVGGAAGALAGAQFGKGNGQIVATAAGALLGAFLGSEAGASMDKADRMYHERAANQALESAPVGKPIVWQNPDNGNNGQVIVNRTYQQSTGDYCREYQQTVTIGGKQQNAYGTACRMPDGSWQIANSGQPAAAQPQQIAAQPAQIYQPQPRYVRMTDFDKTVVTPSAIYTSDAVLMNDIIYTEDAVLTRDGIFHDDGRVLLSNGTMIDTGW